MFTNAYANRDAELLLQAPAWARTERYDNCEKPVRKTGLFGLGFFRLFHRHI